MSRLRIDFAPPGPHRTIYRTHPLAWTLAALAAVLAIGAAGAAWQLHVQQQRFAVALAAAEQHAHVASVHPVVASAAPIPPQQAAAVNAIVARLNTPWRDLRNAVAEATPPTIALLAMEPDARRHVLKLTAEAKDSDGMIAYIEQLKKQELFSTVSLLRHETNDADANRPLRFQLEARWEAR